MKIRGPVPVEKFGNSLPAEQSVEQSWEKRQGLRYLSGEEYRRWDELVELWPKACCSVVPGGLRWRLLISVFWAISIVADLSRAFRCFSRSDWASNFARCRVSPKRGA